MRMKSSHAFLNDSGVVVTPAPMMYRPDSRSRIASGVKSLSLDTSTSASYILLCSRSMAPMTMAMSVVFLPAT